MQLEKNTTINVVFIFRGKSFNASSSVYLLRKMSFDKNDQHTSLNGRAVVQAPERGMSG